MLICTYNKESTMPYRNVYLAKEEDEFVKAQPEGFIRALVIQRMEAGDAFVSMPRVGSETVVDRITKESRVKREANPFLCKECGQTKCAGRCINKNCKLKGKLQ